MNYYRKVIEQLQIDGYDWRGIVYKIAAKNPKVVVEAMGVNAWKQEARKIRDNEGKLPAIKYCRAETGMRLKEAKEAVENL